MRLPTKHPQTHTTTTTFKLNFLSVFHHQVKDLSPTLDTCDTALVPSLHLWNPVEKLTFLLLSLWLFGTDNVFLVRLHQFYLLLFCFFFTKYFHERSVTQTFWTRGSSWLGLEEDVLLKYFTRPKILRRNLWLWNMASEPLVLTESKQIPNQSSPQGLHCFNEHSLWSTNNQQPAELIAHVSHTHTVIAQCYSNKGKYFLCAADKCWMSCCELWVHGSGRAREPPAALAPLVLYRPWI